MKRPTPAERDKINQTAARVRRQQGEAAHAAAGDVEAAGAVYDLPAWEISRALRDRVFDLDAVATMRGGESANDLRSNLGPLGLARGWAH